jgi:K+-transporting ATPase KdpF subunit
MSRHAGIGLFSRYDLQWPDQNLAKLPNGLGNTRGAIHDIPDSPLFNPFIVSNLPLPQVNFYGILTPVTGRLSSSCSVKGALPYDRSFLYWRCTDLICPLRRAGLGFRTTVAEVVMAITYLLCGIIALGLFVYLLVALLKPELF